MAARAHAVGRTRGLAACSLRIASAPPPPLIRLTSARMLGGPARLRSRPRQPTRRGARSRTCGSMRGGRRVTCFSRWPRLNVGGANAWARFPPQFPGRAERRTNECRERVQNNESARRASSGSDTGCPAAHCPRTGVSWTECQRVRLVPAQSTKGSAVPRINRSNAPAINNVYRIQKLL